MRTMEAGSDYDGNFGNNREQALVLLLPIVDIALNAHQSGDYLALRQVITDELALEITEAGFAKACRQMNPTLGGLVNKHLIAALNRQGDPMLVFCAKYDKSMDDILIKVPFENDTYPPRIKWLWIE